MTTLYTTEALSTGDGRRGRVALADGSLAFDLATPREMGGTGDGANPEQLFAAGYAACFHSALKAVARNQKISVGDTTVGARVSIGPNDQGGYQLAVHLEVVVPELDHDAAQALADAAHQVCPYSNATRGNIEVVVTVSED